MTPSIDFLNVKTIIRYLVAFAAVLVAGALLRDIAALLITTTLLYYIVRRNLYRSLELWLIWFFSNGFYFGQGYIEQETVAKYIAKPSFLLLIIFISFYTRIPARFKTSTYSVLHV